MTFSTQSDASHTPVGNPSHKYRPDIDGLRAVAVLAVIAYHAFPEAIRGGFIGVDIFFVISGFLISTIVFENMEVNRFSIIGFYSRRIRRIFPALLVVLSSMLIAGWILLLGVDYALLGKHVASGAGFSANIILWLEADYFDVSAELKPLLHLWSLGIEEQYYLLWPAIMCALWKPGCSLYKPLLTLFIASLCLNLYYTYTDKALAFYAPFSRLWEILLGSLLAYATFLKKDSSKSTSQSHFANARSLLGATLICVGFGVITNKSSFPGWLAVLPTFGTALIIAGGPQAWINSKLLSQPALVWIGLISFPLYLWHWPLLSLARIENGQAVSPETRWTIIASSFVLSWATYRFVERPLRFGGSGNVKTILLLCLMGAVGSAGYLTFRSEGFPNRFPEIIRTTTSHIPFAWGDHVRSEVCHLHLVTSTVHKSECFEVTRPLVALWGDSHAASLYPGLKKLQSSRQFGVIQLNQSGCPPLLGVDKFNFRHNCKQVNDEVVKKLIETKPDVVILHGTWWSVVDPFPAETIYAGAVRSVRTLKEQLPYSKIFIIGPVPRWKDSAQKAIYQAWEDSIDKTKEPPLMLDAKILTDVEDTLAKAAAEAGATYLSLTPILCDRGKCMSRLGPTQLDIVATDDGHLSPNASIYVIRKIETSLFQ
jgi:peptidoglycan/LPS O-acetylase OafA/YrhL